MVGSLDAAAVCGRAPQVDLPVARIIQYNSASLFGFSDNGSFRRYARLRPHHRTAELQPCGAGPGPAAILGDRCRQATGGATWSAAPAAHDAPRQPDTGRRGVLSTLPAADRRS